MPVFMKFDGVDGEFNGGDSIDFSQLTTEPTAPEDGTTKVYSKPLTFTATVTTPYDDGLLLPAVRIDDGEASNGGEDSRGLFQINVDPAQPDVDTFDCSELTQWASGTPLEGGVRKGDWITDVTYESVELLGQSTVATETLTIAHEGFLFI